MLDLVGFSQFHFLRPQAFWLMVPWIFIGVLLLLERSDRIRWAKAIAPHLRPFMISEGQRRQANVVMFTSYITMMLGILALAGPTWEKAEVPGRTLKTPVVVVLELTPEMEKTDIAPSRVEQALFKIRDFLALNPRAQVALIVFSGSAHTVVPLTTDYDIHLEHLMGLSPDVMPVEGRVLSDALTLADSTARRTEAPGFIWILGTVPIAEEIAYMSVFCDTSDQAIRYSQVSSSPHGELGKAGFEFLPLTLDNSDIEQLNKEVFDQLDYTEDTERSEENWTDKGPLLLIPFALLLLLWFRRGWVIFLLIFTTSCTSDSANWWFTPDYQGQRLSEKERYTDAARLYTDPLRKGVAYFKSGDFESAISAFKRDTTSMGQFNLGVAYYENGDTLAALMAFGEAYAQDSSMNQAKQWQDQLQQIIGSQQDIDPSEASENNDPERAQNMQNQDMEDLGGGGQEATEEDMQRERKEETVSTDVRKGKELEEVPDDIEIGNEPVSSKVLMRRTDDDPQLFLKRKFAYQWKKKQAKK
ncbi:VWA domain-containing protein [Cryomorphaceae bacterium]|nr:VWA domain-containing protein [Cryomorphaceae bacterium]